jgi:hypothetical protein
MERIRETAKTRLTAIIAQSPHFSASAGAAQKFAQEVEAAVLERCPTPRRYRDRVLFLTANLPHVLDDLDSMTPEFLSAVDEPRLKSDKQKRADEREARKRAREIALTLKDSDEVKCDRCGLPIRARLNTNRFDVEDEILGQQFQNQYDTLCQCDADKDPTEHFGQDTPPTSEDDDTESETRTTTDQANKHAQDSHKSPVAKATRTE